MNDPAIDEANAKFWNELCGTTFAQALGITDHSAESLRRFDQGYMDLYPYLLDRVPVDRMRGKKVLEIGLGYGTLGQKIAEAGAEYAGLDIAAGPVDMMNHRLRMRGLAGKAIQGSMLNCPFPGESLDYVVSIGCFHHTGDIGRCLEETWRVLKPGGTAYLMVYNRFSYRRWREWFWPTLREAVGLRRKDAGRASVNERKAYDANSSGEAAPETVFVSLSELRHLMSRFSRASLALENCGPISLRGLVLIPRRAILPIVGRLAGLDIYVDAAK